MAEPSVRANAPRRRASGRLLAVASIASLSRPAASSGAPREIMPESLDRDDGSSHRKAYAALSHVHREATSRALSAAEPKGEPPSSSSKGLEAGAALEAAARHAKATEARESGTRCLKTSSFLPETRSVTAPCCAASAEACRARMASKVDARSCSGAWFHLQHTHTHTHTRCSGALSTEWARGGAYRV